jgi:hypothetical protein
MPGWTTRVRAVPVGKQKHPHPPLGPSPASGRRKRAREPCLHWRAGRKGMSRRSRNDGMLLPLAGEAADRLMRVALRSGIHSQEAKKHHPHPLYSPRPWGSPFGPACAVRARSHRAQSGPSPACRRRNKVRKPCRRSSASAKTTSRQNGRDGLLLPLAGDKTAGLPFCAANAARRASAREGASTPAGRLMRVVHRSRKPVSTGKRHPPRPPLRTFPASKGRGVLSMRCGDCFARASDRGRQPRPGACCRRRPVTRSRPACIRSKRALPIRPAQ